MARPIDPDSNRQKIIVLEVGESAVFPIRKMSSISSSMYAVAREYTRKYKYETTKQEIKVTRIL